MDACNIKKKPGKRGRRPSGRCGPAEKGKGAARPPGKRGRGLPAPPLRAPCPSRGRTRPARARRPVLPRTGSAVLWAMAGLAAEFGMGSGDPRLRGRARAGRPLRFPSGTSRAPWRPHSVVRETSSSRDRPPRGIRGREARARAISTARLNASRRLQLRPIDLVVYEGPYRRENSSRRRLPA